MKKVAASRLKVGSLALKTNLKPTRPDKDRSHAKLQRCAYGLRYFSFISTTPVHPAIAPFASISAMVLR